MGSTLTPPDHWYNCIPILYTSLQLWSIYHVSLKLEITHCTGLAKADRFGLSDPFCIVKWPTIMRKRATACKSVSEGKRQQIREELGRTPTVYSTVHPVWKKCSFELPLDAPETESNLHTRAARDTGSGDSGEIIHGDGGGDIEPDDRVHGNESGEKDVIELTVEVWDEDDGVAGDFLGELNFGADALLEMAKGRQMLVSNIFCSVERRTSMHMCRSDPNASHQAPMCSPPRLRCFGDLLGPFGSCKSHYFATMPETSATFSRRDI